MLLLLIKVYGIFLHAEIIRIINDVDAEIDAALYRMYTTPFAHRSQLILNLAQFREYVLAASYLRTHRKERKGRKG